MAEDGEVHDLVPDVQLAAHVPQEQLRTRKHALERNMACKTPPLHSSSTLTDRMLRVTWWWVVGMKLLKKYWGQMSLPMTARPVHTLRARVTVLWLSGDVAPGHTSLRTHEKGEPDVYY